MDVDAHLAGRVRDLRKARGHTLDGLAELSGVSRSMISLIERQETSPTAAVLGKLADAFGVSLASLFAEESRDDADLPLARHAEQPVWKDPASGYVRRQLSPGGYPSLIELVEVTFPAGEAVAFDSVVRSHVTHQQVWVLAGEMEITMGERSWQLRTGDCLAMVLGQRIVFTNPGRKPARYALALTTSACPSRRP